MGSIAYRMCTSTASSLTASPSKYTLTVIVYVPGTSLSEVLRSKCNARLSYRAQPVEPPPEKET